MLARHRHLRLAICFSHRSMMAELADRLRVWSRLRFPLGEKLASLCMHLSFPDSRESAVAECVFDSHAQRGRRSAS
jgi:hypothetical protein